MRRSSLSERGHSSTGGPLYFGPRDDPKDPLMRAIGLEQPRAAAPIFER
jgi:hypothetical protein